MSRLGLFATVCATMLCASDASGVLFSQYTFNDATATDTLGNWSGTVVDPLGLTQNVGGQLDLRANNNIRSDAAAMGAYVDLPNGIATAALQSGQSNAASFEMWITIETNRQWARVFDFGTSDGGEDNPTTAGGQDYLMLVPQGFGPQVLAFEPHTGVPPVPPDPSPSNVLTSSRLTPGVEHHIVVIFDQNETTPERPGGTARLYLNNTLAGTGAISSGLLPGQLFNENNDWLGRSQWGGDVLIDGLYNEFRIYDHVLSATEVANNFAAGAVEAPFPTLVVDRDTGTVTIENQHTAAQQLTGYTITSGAGGLNVSASWDPIAPNNGWTIQTESATEVSEMGGTPVNISGGGEVNIGTAWIPSQFEDLNFSFELTGGVSGLGAVEFVGNGGAPFARSDLDTDGNIDAADWVAFLAGNATDLSGLSAVARSLKGDLNNDGANNHADFLLFRQDYNAANGAGSFEALTAGVPEPTAFALAVLAAVSLGTARLRDRNR